MSWLNLHTLDWVLIFIGLVGIAAVKWEAWKAKRSIQEQWDQMYKGHIPLRED